MSDLTLKINADFDKATKAFEELASSSEETRKKLETYSKTISDKTVDDFTEKQKKLQIQMTGTRGETVALQKSVDAYQKEIERHIRNGLNPNHEAIIKLRNEQEQLNKKIKENIEIEKARENAMKNIEKITLGLYAALAAGATAMLKMTNDTAKAGNEFSKTSKVVGLTAETLQEFNYAAKQNGVNNLTGHLEKLNKSLIDTKNGTGTLTKYLSDNNKELLEQIKNVNNNEEAFNLLMNEIHNIKDPLEKSELAMAAFGKSGQEMVLMAKDGVQGLNALRNEAREYGIISNDIAEKSEDYITAQDRLKQSFEGVKIELTDGLIPGITDTMNKLADFISNVDDWDKILKIVIISLGSLTAGLTAFLAVSKGHAIINQLTIAIRGFMLAVSGPAGIAAIAVAGLVAGISTLISLQNEANRAGEIFADNINKTSNEANRLLNEYKNLNGEKTLDIETSNKLLKLYPDLINRIDIATASTKDYANAIKEINREQAIKTASEWREKWRQANEDLERYNNNLSNGRAVNRQYYADAVSTAENAEKQINAILSSVNMTFNTTGGTFLDLTPKYDKQALDRVLREYSDNVNSNNETIRQNSSETLKNIIDDSEKTLQQRLNNISLSEQQVLNQQVNTIKQFLMQRAALETDDFDNRIKFIENQKNYLLSEETGFQEEKFAIEKAANELINQLREEQNNFELNQNKILSNNIINNKIETIDTLIDLDKKYAKSEREIIEGRLDAYSEMFGSISKLINVFNEDSEEALKYQKLLAIADVAINTSVAIMRAWAQSSSWQEGLARTIALAAQGTTQAAVIAATEIPSKTPSGETGGRFIVPRSNRVDDKLYRFNGGEEINVTPRGMTGNSNESFNFNFIFDGQVFSEIINKQARAGELYTLQLAGNL